MAPSMPTTVSFWWMGGAVHLYNGTDKLNVGKRQVDANMRGFCNNIILRTSAAHLGGSAAPDALWLDKDRVKRTRAKGVPQAVIPSVDKYAASWERAARQPRRNR